MFNLIAHRAAVDMGDTLTSITGLFSDFSVANLLSIVGAALGVTVALFLFWFAFRWIKGKIVSALKKGRV